MKYGKEINGKIRQFNGLPKAHRRADGSNCIGGYNLLSDAEVAKDGFFPMLKSTCDPAIQEVGDWEFDPITRKWIQPVTDKVLVLADIREQKLEQLMDSMEMIQTAGRRYFTMLKETGQPIPAAIKTKRDAIYTKLEQFRTYITTESDPVKLAKYTIPESEIQTAIRAQRKLK